MHNRGKCTPVNLMSDFTLWVSSHNSQPCGRTMLSKKERCYIYSGGLWSWHTNNGWWSWKGWTNDWIETATLNNSGWAVWQPKEPTVIHTLWVIHIYRQEFLWTMPFFKDGKIHKAKLIPCLWRWSLPNEIYPYTDSRVHSEQNTS